MREGYDVGLKKGEANGQMKETETDTWKHSYGHCVLVEEGQLMLVTEVMKAMASKQADPTTRSDACTQVAPTTYETASQTNGNTKHQCEAPQTEPVDDDSPSSLKNMPVALCIDSNIQTTTKPAEPTAQTETDPTALVNSPPSPPSIATSPVTTPAQPASTMTTPSSTTTTTSPPAPKPPPAPRK